MKNVLIIPPFNPYPLVSGGHQAVFNGIAILEGIANAYLIVPVTESQHNKGVDTQINRLLPFVHVLSDIDPASRHTLTWYCKVLKNKMCEFLPCKKDKPSLVKSEMKVGNSQLADIQDVPDYKVQFILNAISKYKIDIVQVEMMENIKLVEYLPSNVQKIFVQHEIKFVRDELFMRTLSDVTDEMMKQYILNKNEEIELHNKYDKIVTLSPIDTQKLSEAGVTTPITTSLAVVNPLQRSKKRKVSKRLSYVGPESHYPNYEGVMWFLDTCWPILMKKDSEYTLQIIGLWSEQTSAEMNEKYDGKVRCLGFVDDLADALAGTTMIVPLNIGSGIRMKILEAAQLNVPIVTTPVGGEGLPLVDGENSFITDNPEEFVDGILKLQDEKLRERFVLGIRKEIANKYSLQALKDSRNKLYLMR